MNGKYDVVVIGAGHAGCEAALAASRMGLDTLVVTLNLDSIALMPCNPAIGGTSKGHLVREVDALGGEMGLNIDATAIQTRMLNTSKGPAVQSLRAQADKKAYQARMKSVLESQEHLDILQGEVTRILTEHGRVCGVEAVGGMVYPCRAVVLAAGVYLRSRVFTGMHGRDGGPAGLMPATHLTADLLEKGLHLLRFKTGTPARVNARTVDFSAMEVQPGDPHTPAFSFMTDSRDCVQMPCFLTWTNGETHRIIRENLDRSPLYGGLMTATAGVRYCPSIEDKVVRFADKERHQIFLEPEGRNTLEYYVQGMSTSLPEDVQLAMLHSLPGMEHCKVMRFGYAIEYDLLDSLMLDASLALRPIPGMFAAGQINGTSGYEEAAAQGVLAGINAALYCKNEEPLVLKRSDAYLGVLVDDLVTKGATEPYRMMTARAEYRLLLRQDNADLRLTGKGRRAGLVTDERYARLEKKREDTEKLLAGLRAAILPPTEALTKVLAAKNFPPVQSGIRASELLRRPGMRLADVEPLMTLPDACPAAKEQAEIALRYEGYLSREEAEVQHFLQLENRTLPPDTDYNTVSGLRLEARTKLTAQQPKNLGQASRILGVSPADIGVLLVWLERRKHDA